MIGDIKRVKRQNTQQEAAIRVSREQAAQNHQRIVETASRLFRQQGFDGVSVDTIMQQAGLTHGGFYGHFKSKDDLAAQAVVRALERSSEGQGRYTDIGELVSQYLSQRHCADRACGCAIAALGTDIARQGKGVRQGLTAHIRARLDHLARLLRGGTAADRRKRAIATLGGIVGALTLARAVDDPVLSKEILAAAAEFFGKAGP
jgi:TetR/AcrR family transcriptional regulator, transcriptional repressor for nem operon